MCYDVRLKFMNPYKSPVEQSEVVDDSSSDVVTSDLSEHPRYDGVLTMVLWGEPKEDVFARMKTNKVTPDLADLLYSHAHKERVALIRTENRSKILLGLASFVLGVVVFCLLWFGLGIIPRIVVGGCFLAGVFGSWKVIDGLVGYTTAQSKKGSVADS